MKKSFANQRTSPFPPSLRLRFTFPFAEPQAEVSAVIMNLLHKNAQPRSIAIGSGSRFHKDPFSFG
jgi:hypothetical protein